MMLVPHSYFHVYLSNKPTLWSSAPTKTDQRLKTVTQDILQNMVSQMDPSLCISENINLS